MYCCAAYFFNYLGGCSQSTLRTTQWSDNPQIVLLSQMHMYADSMSVFRPLLTLRLQVSGLKESLRLEGNQYSILIAMFTAGYIFKQTHLLKTDHNIQQCMCRPDTTRPHHSESLTSLLAPFHPSRLVWLDYVLRCMQNVRATLRSPIPPRVL